MKNHTGPFITALIILLLTASGCTVHKFQKAEKSDGYVVARYNYVMPEYTVDTEKKAPASYETARKRYIRRKDTVENYYLKMGLIESNFRRYFWHFPMIISSLTANVFKMPFTIVSEYKYEHNEEYRKKIDAIDAKQKAKGDAQKKMLMSELYEYIKTDMEKEDESAGHTE